MEKKKRPEKGSEEGKEPGEGRKEEGREEEGRKKGDWGRDGVGDRSSNAQSHPHHQNLLLPLKWFRFEVDFKCPDWVS